jgi:hypothetical protein
MARQLFPFNPHGGRVATFLRRYLYQVADAVIEAEFPMRPLLSLSMVPTPQAIPLMYCPTSGHGLINGGPLIPPWLPSNKKPFNLSFPSCDNAWNPCKFSLRAAFDAHRFSLIREVERKDAS